MLPKKKSNYEANRKEKIKNEINKLNDENEEKLIDVCESERCKQRLQPKTEFIYKEDGSKSSCSVCRDKYKNKRKMVSPEAAKRAAQKYHQTPNGQFLSKLRKNKFIFDNPEKNAEYFKKYYEKNKDEINKKKRKQAKEMNEIFKEFNMKQIEYTKK